MPSDRGRRREAGGQDRVQDRGRGERAGVAHVELAARPRIGHDAERVRLGSGARRGRDGHDGQRRAREPAAVVEVAPPLRVDGGQGDALGRVDRRPAAHRHQRDPAGARATVRRRHRVGAGRQVVRGRVGVHPAEHGHRYPRGFEHPGDAGHHRRGGQRRVGDHDRGAGAGAADDAGQLADGAGAEVGARRGRQDELGAPEARASTISAAKAAGHDHSWGMSMRSGVPVRSSSSLIGSISPPSSPYWARARR